MVRPQANDIEAIITEALSRHEKGRLEYGKLDLSTDKSDIETQETQD